jgi:hypothetical protein
VVAALEIQASYVHFPLVVGSGRGRPLDSETGELVDWRKVERLRRQTDTPFVNLHLHLGRLGIGSGLCHPWVQQATMGGYPLQKMGAIGVVGNAGRLLAQRRRRLLPQRIHPFIIPFGLE